MAKPEILYILFIIYYIISIIISNNNKGAGCGKTGVGTALKIRGRNWKKILKVG